MAELPLAILGMLTGSLLFAMVVGNTGQNGEHKLPDYLERLKNAPKFDDSAVGYAAQRSDTFKAFEMAYLAGSAISEDLEWLLHNGSPAGRLYAAILIVKLDKEAGKKALESLKSDADLVEYRSGSLVETRSVGELAADALKGETLIILPPNLK
jgi:hypothetical protein